MREGIARERRAPSRQKALELDAESADPAPMLVSAFDMHLHAAVTVDGRDRRRLERVCRYLLRPTFARDAVTRTTDCNVRVDFKAPRRSGASYAEKTLDTFLARLCALVDLPTFASSSISASSPIATRSALASCPPERPSRPHPCESDAPSPTRTSSPPHSTVYAALHVRAPSPSGRCSCSSAPDHAHRRLIDAARSDGCAQVGPPARRTWTGRARSHGPPTHERAQAQVPRLSRLQTPVPR
jgi:hypothetical protein